MNNTSSPALWEVSHPECVPRTEGVTAADALREINMNLSLTPIQKRDSASAMVAVVRIARPVNTGVLTAATVEAVARTVSLSCSGLRPSLFTKAPAFYGYANKRTFENMLSLNRATLRRLNVHAPELPQFEDLPAEWQTVLTGLTKYRLIGVIGFAGFCAVEGILPDQVTPQTLDRYETWLVESTLTRDPHKISRHTASSWSWASANHPAFPAVRLVRANMSDHYALPWDAYSDSMRESADAMINWLAGLGNQDLAEAMFSEAGPATGARKISRAKKPRTLSTRRDCLKIGLAALVRSGVSPASLLSVRDLVSPPSRARQVMSFHLRRTRDHLLESVPQEDVPPLHEITSSNLFNIAETLRQVAVFCELPDDEVAAIAAMGRQVTKGRQVCMTEKNMQRLAALIQPRPKALLLALPAKLMAQAAKIGETKTAARLAMAATALEILSIVPVRRENLADMRLDNNLMRLNPSAMVHEIFVPADRVKNQESIEAPLPEESADLLEIYLRDFRLLLTQAENPYLFPSDDLEGRQAAALAVMLKTIVEQETGCEFNLHLMRHFAVYRYLSENPGDFETARRLLGHKDVDTTRRFYDGLTKRFAAIKYADSVIAERKQTGSAIPPPYKLRRKG